MLVPSFYPEARDCLKNLSELHCGSCISSEIFYQLSQLCQNILLLDINHDSHSGTLDGLAHLISVQRNLKHFILIQYFNNLNKNITSLITKLPNTLIKLNLCKYNRVLSLLFITKFLNLQELEFEIRNSFIDFDKLSYVIFPHLQILNFKISRPNSKSLTRFLENNGRNLKEFCTYETDNTINLAISKFCINLRKLSVGFISNELEMLETFGIVLKSCNYLKSIKIYHRGKFLKEVWRVIVKHSLENISEVILHHYNCKISADFLQKELVSYFTSWGSREPLTLLSLVIICNHCKKCLDENEENMKVIKECIKLVGVIKNYNIIKFVVYSEGWARKN
ncbi:hypothetical protein RclHR1_01140013 [Rhizophagus clarus]|uniref:F-box domain-containing protein n=1 Tax=Rhizophagus clarus TaxID=94130 RepID=A0A2Z6QJ41_9GLOM|nr:hypothetical protein RclHR1_01140013 [Rhizophagus clarus]GES97886.1 hypothetical protein GLOIN_2v1573959 [Rhizophagus clarus]